MSVIEQLNVVFREVFEDEQIMVKTETTADDVDGWDSLSHVTLIVAVETHFRIKFTQKELLTMRNVCDLAVAIESELNRRPEVD